MNENSSAFCRNCGAPLPARFRRKGEARTAPSASPARRLAAPRPIIPARLAARQRPASTRHRRSAPYTGMPSPASEFRLDLRRLSRVDQTVGIASLIVFIALFLPWYGFSELRASFSISGTSAHGYLVIVLVLALLLVGYLLLRSGWDTFP